MPTSWSQKMRNFFTMAGGGGGAEGGNVGKVTRRNVVALANANAVTGVTWALYLRCWHIYRYIILASAGICQAEN